MEVRPNRLKFIYGVALAVVATCMVSASWLMQHSISSNSDEARIINLSGRQRMLSQRLTKAVLALPRAVDPESLRLRTTEIEDSFRVWQKADKGLREGDIDLGLPARELSPTVRQLFSDIQPHQVAMESAIDRLLAALQSPAGKKQVIEQAGDELLAHEPAFLRGMDAITFQFDKEAREKLTALQTIERTALAIGLLILAVEFLGSSTNAVVLASYAQA